MNDGELIEEYEDGEFEDEEEYDEDEELGTDEEDEEEFDGQVEDVEEDSEEEPQAVVGPGRASGATTANAPRNWTGLQNLPAKTLNSFSTLLQQLKAQNKNKLTILLLGKSMMGKSSTANSLYNEQVAQIRSFQQDVSLPEVVRRAAQGFELAVIDTPGLLESDNVSSQALKSIAKILKDNPVDVVLYLDRLDVYRVENTDQEIMSAITNTLGPQIWKNAVIGLTHGKAVAPPGTQQDEYLQKRVESMRKAIKAAGAGNAALPAAFIENSSHCPTNSDGEKVIGVNRDRRWLPDLMTQVVSVAQSASPFVYDPKTSKKRNPNKRRRWLIPLLIVAQIAFKKYVIDGILEDDGVTGDQYGPYDPDTVKEERDRLKAQKANAKARQQADREKLAKQAAKKKAQAQSQISSGAAKIKNTVQDALPDSSSSDDSSSDSD